MSLRKAALLTAIGLGLGRAHTAITQLRFIIGNFHWVYLTREIGNILFSLPFPVLLLMLSRSEPALAVSRRMRQGALGAALVHGLLYTIPGIIGWAPVLRADVYEISSFGGITLADNIIGWFNQQSSKIVIQFWDVVGIFWQVTIVLLLIALSRCRGTLPESDARPSRLLRKVAVLAAITSGLALIIDIGGTVHWVANLDKSQSNWFPFTVPTMGQVIFRSTINMIPELCRLAVAVIVYRSLPTYASVPVERPLDSPNP